jgi:SnoaL-like domain
VNGDALRDCGCLVSQGVRTASCNTPHCCCAELPLQLRTPDEIADQLGAAFASRDLSALGRLLAADARWGDDDHPNKCRTRAEVLSTFERLLGEGTEGEVTETVIGPRGVAVRLRVRWQNPGDGRVVDFYQAYLVREGYVTDIQRHDNRRSTIAAIAP